MTPYYADESVTLHHGDCLDVLRSLPDASVDSVVTDPPYGLEFMGKEWDGADGFRRSLNPNDAGRDNAFGRTSRTSPEYRTTSKAAAGMTGTGYTDGAERLERPSHLGGLNPRCRNCGKWQRGGNPCRCESPDFPNERLPRLHSFQEWCEAWSRECLRVLKPGGHMLAFGGTRTWHRLACAVEDAGFEVRDSIAWIYGSGFPKSHNVRKALGDNACRCDQVESEHGEQATEHGMRALSDADVSPPLRVDQRPGSVLLPRVSEPGAPATGRSELPTAQDGRGEPGMEGRSHDQAAEGQLRRPALRPLPAGVPADGTEGRLRHGAPARHGATDRPDADPHGVRGPRQPRPEGQSTGEPGALPDERGSQAGRGWPLCGRCGKPTVEGLGTALKPAFEPIVVARKPLVGTVVANVLAHGTGALNIEACRVGTQATTRTKRGGANDFPHEDDSWTPRDVQVGSDAGRWPANVVLDESQADVLDEQSGERPAGGKQTAKTGDSGIYGAFGAVENSPYDDTGGASRFFYVAKAGQDERPRVNGTAHPTVKPLELMRWLVRLVTPPGGTVLEPFAGSGATVEACIVEHFHCIAIEREADYLPLIESRIARRRDPVKAITLAGGDLGLFGEGIA